MKALIAQQSTPTNQPPSPSLSNWAEGAVILAAIAYLIRTVVPSLFSSWLKRSELESQHDINSEAVTLSTVLTTLTKMQDAVLTQQNTLITNLLNKHQIAIEDIELAKAINSQNQIFKTLIENQQEILKCVRELSLNQEQDSNQN
ncbi:hypothetical protein [Pseudanabaena sp. PCC 6802]|uniref:hypothetical protein n=1 Tax=Pseudanabaena sp. PCC 6802 TaxID=118173 RepID=UPI000345FD03|nr:hypothetical protein [Pseudanabaena sp. PCC 6802]